MNEQDMILPEGWEEGDDLFAVPAGADAPPSTEGAPSTEGGPSQEGAASRVPSTGADPYREGVPSTEGAPSPQDDGPLWTASQEGALPPDASRALARILGADRVPDGIPPSEAEGGGPLTAFAVWQARQALREVERLRRENEGLRQLRDAASRAPVRGVSGGAARPAPRSDFERGFDADGW